MFTARALSSRSRTTSGVMRDGIASAGIQFAPMALMSRPFTRTLKE